MSEGQEPTPGQASGDGQSTNPPAAGQAPTPGQTSGSASGQQGGQAPPLGPDGQPWDMERALRKMTALETEAKEAKRLAKELTDAQAKLKEHEDQQLSETEKLTNQVRDLTGKLEAAETARRATTIRAAVLMMAAKLEFVDPEDAVLLLPSVGQVELNDGGEPTNVEALLKDLVKAKPHLKKPAADGQRIPSTPSGNGSGALPQVSEDEQKRHAREFARSF
jgi:hypothetical protein